jgi:microcystin-dependent protein
VSEPYLSEIRIMAFNFPPRGWAQCNGQLLPISQNQALFALLGTTYGGDGQVTFGVPNLQARTPIHMGPGYSLAGSGGDTEHPLIIPEVPVHTHTVYGTTTDGDSPIPTGNYLGAADNLYGAPTSTVALQQDTVTVAGGGQPHPNVQPYLVLNFCIALTGMVPSRN